MRPHLVEVEDSSDTSGLKFKQAGNRSMCGYSSTLTVQANFTLGYKSSMGIPTGTT